MLEKRGIVFRNTSKGNKPISDKIARHALNIRSLSSTPPFAKETKLLAIDLSKLVADKAIILRISFITSIRSPSFLIGASNDLKYYFIKNLSKTAWNITHLTKINGYKSLLKLIISSSVDNKYLIALKAPDRISGVSWTVETRKLEQI